MSASTTQGGNKKTKHTYMVQNRYEVLLTSQSGNKWGSIIKLECGLMPNMKHDGCPAEYRWRGANEERKFLIPFRETR